MYLVISFIYEYTTKTLETLLLGGVVKEIKPKIKLTLK